MEKLRKLHQDRLNEIRNLTTDQTELKRRNIELKKFLSEETVKEGNVSLGLSTEGEESSQSNATQIGADQSYLEPKLQKVST